MGISWRDGRSRSALTGSKAREGGVVEVEEVGEEGGVVGGGHVVV